MLTVLKPIAAAAILGLAAQTAGAAPFQVTGRDPADRGARVPPAQLEQERTRRAARDATDPRRTAPAVRMARASNGPGEARMPRDELPGGARTSIPASPHATDPGTPGQAMTRSARRSLRAPETPDARRTDPAKAPRMDIATDIRTGRASFEDWLFGR